MTISYLSRRRTPAFLPFGIKDNCVCITYPLLLIITYSLLHHYYNSFSPPDSLPLSDHPAAPYPAVCPCCRSRAERRADPTQA